jgi:hypothetical protein
MVLSKTAGKCRMSLLSVSHANPSVEEAIASYRAAHYCIEPAGASAVILRIGERSAGLAVLYSELGVESCAFLTASNPLGVVLRDADNAVAMTALCVDVHALGLALLPGVSRDGDPASSWPGEESVAVLGISRDAASELGHRYQQNAIVWAGSDAVPELILLR